MSEYPGIVGVNLPGGVFWKSWLRSPWPRESSGVEGHKESVLPVEMPGC